MKNHDILKYDGQRYSSLAQMPVAALRGNIEAVDADLARPHSAVDQDYMLDCRLAWMKELSRRSGAVRP